MARWHGNFFDNIFLVQAAAYFFQCLHLEAPNTMYNNLMWGIYYFLFKIQVLRAGLFQGFLFRFYLASNRKIYVEMKYK
jgi:hypothetical protein